MSWVEAIDYYEKALQRDPNYARTHNNLGLALQAQGRLDEAIDCYQKALQIDPDYAWAHHDLGDALRARAGGQAIDHYRQAIRLDPKVGYLHVSLGDTLQTKGRLDEAIDHYQLAFTLDPRHSRAPERRPQRPGAARTRDAAQVAWRKVLDANPHEHDAWFGFAELCLFLGQEDEYRRARRALLEHFGVETDPSIAEPVSRACLLLPGSGGRTEAGDRPRRPRCGRQEIDAALDLPIFSVRQGPGRVSPGPTGQRDRPDGRGSVPSHGTRPSPDCGHGPIPSGAGAAGRKTLATAVVGFDWSAAEADSRDVWICHILRREAEATILPDLPAFVQGEYQPRDNDERLALLGICEFQGADDAAARLYADAFAADPALAEDLTRHAFPRQHEETNSLAADSRI